MFLKQADGRKSPFPKPWSTDKRPNHHNQRRFNRRQSIPALLPCPDPRIIPDVPDGRPDRAPYCTHCGFGSPQSNTSARRENHLVILAVSYARADNFISSFLIAPRLSSLCRNQCHPAQVRIANYSFGKMPRPKHFGTILPAHQQTQLPCATDCKTPMAIALHHCVQAVARNYLHPPQWAQPASNPSFCARAHTGIRR